MYVVGCTGVGGAAGAGFDSTTGGGVSTVAFVGGVDVDRWVCECADGVDG
jgi:hypothetical protein